MTAGAVAGVFGRTFGQQAAEDGRWSFERADVEDHPDGEEQEHRRDPDRDLLAGQCRCDIVGHRLGGFDDHGGGCGSGPRGGRSGSNGRVGVVAGLDWRGGAGGLAVLQEPERGTAGFRPLEKVLRYLGQVDLRVAGDSGGLPGSWSAVGGRRQGRDLPEPSSYLIQIIARHATRSVHRCPNNASRSRRSPVFDASRSRRSPVSDASRV